MADRSGFLAGRRVAVFAFSRQGMETARRACRALDDAGERRLYAPARLAEGDFQPITGSLADFVGPLFQWADAPLFVSSCGIAVRAVAPHLRHKAADPAVLAVDERARFVVPLLSGHIGGANRLARILADALGGTAVVTTATDVSGKFSVDAWAAEQGLHIDSMEDAKAVSAAILEGPVGLASDFPVVGELPSGVVWTADPPAARGERPAVGFCVSWRRREIFGRTLLLIPKAVRLGIGCRRGTGREDIRAAVDRALEESGIQRAAVRCAASIGVLRGGGTAPRLLLRRGAGGGGGGFYAVGVCPFRHRGGQRLRAGGASGRGTADYEKVRPKRGHRGGGGGALGGAVWVS